MWRVSEKPFNGHLIGPFRWTVSVFLPQITRKNNHTSRGSTRWSCRDCRAVLLLDGSSAADTNGQRHTTSSYYGRRWLFNTIESELARARWSLVVQDRVAIREKNRTWTVVIAWRGTDNFGKTRSRNSRVRTVTTATTELTDWWWTDNCDADRLVPASGKSGGGGGRGSIRVRPARILACVCAGGARQCAAATFGWRAGWRGANEKGIFRCPRRSLSFTYTHTHTSHKRACRCIAVTAERTNNDDDGIGRKARVATTLHGRRSRSKRIFALQCRRGRLRFATENVLDGYTVARAPPTIRSAFEKRRRTYYISFFNYSPVRPFVCTSCV